MKALNQNLLSSKKEKHLKLSQRFLKLLKSGSFKRLSSRKQYRIVERIKKLERQLKDYQLSGREALNINFKHWAVALALGVVSYTASAQEKSIKKESKGVFGIEREINKEQLKKNYLKARTSESSNKRALGFTVAATLGQPGMDDYIQGDFDGDGDIDIIYGSSYSGNNYMLRNNGNFNFENEQIQFEKNIDDDELAGDFDGDGDLDILFSSYGEYEETFGLFLNDGAANFTRVEEVFVSSSNPEKINLIDLENDGDLDLIYYGWNTSQVLAAKNDGTGVFTESVILPQSGGLYNVGDFDDDGDMDILVQEPYEEQYYSGVRNVIAFNDGTGQFISSGIPIDNNLDIWSTYVEDVDNDGDQDIISSIGYWDEYGVFSYQLNVFTNNGDGTEFAPLSPVNLNALIYGLELVDLNDDGLVDIYSPYETQDVFINNGNGNFEPSDVNIPRGLREIGDLDQDGDIDFMALGAAYAQAWRNDGELNFTLAADNILELSSTTGIGLTDLNNDGALDIIQIGVSKVWMNSGNSQDFSVGQRLGTIDNGGTLSDVDDDGDLDLLTIIHDRSHSGHIANIWSNNEGTFERVDSIGIDVTGSYFYTTGLDVGDVDGDGDMDLVILSQTFDSANGVDKNHLAILTNDGSGDFSIISEHSFESDALGNLQLADMDKDGDVDIVLPKDGEDVPYGKMATDGGFVLGLNDGTGGFTFEISFTAPTEIDSEGGFVVEDFDLDGDMDVFLQGAYGTGYVFINNGDATDFTYTSFAIVEGENIEEGQVGAGDIDNDGDTDLIIYINSYYEDSYYIEKQVFLNDGAGNFSEKISLPQGFGYSYGGAIKLADIDNDGDIDIVSGGVYMPLEVLHNNLITENALEQDMNNLRALYNTLGGEHWTNNENWTTDDVSTWSGVTVSGGRVTSIDLSENNLTGAVTSALLNLTALTHIDLSGNNITTVPDLSGLPNLESADISENALDFGDLEPNADVPFLDYSPQAELGEHEVINVPVHTEVSLSENSSGSNNSYQWYFNNEPLDGETNPELLIPDITESTMGEYYVEVTNSLLPDLTLKSIADQVNATATLAGLLADTEGNVVNDAEVILLRVTSSNGFDTVATVNPNIDGFYSFSNVVLSHYQVMGDPDLDVNPNLLPTYYPSSIFWEEADTINLTSNISNADIAVNIFVEESLGGTGEISGELFEEVPDEGRILAKKRIAKAGVSIRRGRNSGRSSDTNSKMLEEYDLIAHLKTDENGQFIFTDLTDGVYRLNIQYPGYPMDENSFIDINIGTTGGRIFEENNKVQVEAEVTGGAIVVRNVTVLSVDGNTVMSDIHLFPNPSQGIIHINKNKVVGDLNATLYDMKGKMIYQKQIKEENDQQIDLTAIPNGTYILKLNPMDSNNTERSFKIILE